MKRTLLIVVLGVLIGMPAWAEFCKKCEGGRYITNMGKCANCGNMAATSGSHKYCPACSEKLGKCEHCGADLKGGEPAKDPTTAPTSQPTSGPTSQPTSQPAVSEKSFEIKTVNKADVAKVKNEDGKAIIEVLTPNGIGGATITRKGKEWPKQIVLRLHITAMAQLGLTCGEIKLSASYPDEGLTVQLTKAEKNSKVESDSPYWLDVKTFTEIGKTAKGGLTKNGYFDITLPQALLKENKTLTVNWIDQYRW